MVPSSLGCRSTVLAAMATLAPSAAALSAIARPMPREAPVTNKVFPLSDIRVLSLRSHRVWHSIILRHSGARRISAFTRYGREPGIHNPGALEYGFRVWR